MKGKDSERAKVCRHGEAPEHDGEVRQGHTDCLRNHHQSHGKGRDDAARHGMLQVRPERVEVANEAHDEEPQQARRNDGADDLSIAVKRKSVLHAPTETRHAEGESSHGGRKRTETSVKKAHDQPLTVKKKRSPL